MNTRLHFLFIGLLSSLLTVGAQSLQKNIVYTDSHVRFTTISDGTLRMEYAPDGQFIDDRSHLAVVRQYPEVSTRLREKGGWVEITTSKLRMRYKKESGPFTTDNLSIESVKGAFPFRWHPGMKQKGNLKGTARTLDGMDGELQVMSYVSDSKKGDSIRLGDGLLATDGWTLIDDSKGFLFDNNAEWDWVKERTDTGGQDWYFMAYGHDYKSALKDYTLFAGKIPLPPRYAFGYWWSRYWLYSDKEFRRLIDNFHTYRIPLDVLVVDMDWHYTEKGKGGWTGWTWNRDLFPEPEKFLGYLKQQGLRVTLNLHPADGIKSFEEKYPQMAADMGIDPQSKETVRWVSSDKRFMNSLFSRILSPMERAGVDFWWLDWQQSPFDPKVKGLSNTWWINYVFFSRMEREGEARPLLYHRWGGLGNHRFQVGFSGDAVASWKSLSFQPYFNSTASNVLYGYWSHDLGGHIGDKIDPEMYVRWMQFGAASPIMRTHSQKNSGMNKEPWVFSKDYCNVLRETIRLRYRMVPYIYTMARKAYEEGISLCRPMYYDYPEQTEAHEFKNQYMFGDNMLIAPITSPGKDGYAQATVWLPAGQWYELHSGSLLTGGRTLTRSFGIDEFPLYVKAGSVLPFYTDDIMNLSDNGAGIIVSVFPGENIATEFSLYEDNGTDKHYATEYARTKLTAIRQGDKQNITIGKREGQYRNMPDARPMKLKVYASVMPLSVTINGRPAKSEYIGEEFAFTVDLGTSLEEKTIEIRYPNENIDFNGLQGAAKRIAHTLEALKYRKADICLTDELGQMGSLSEAVGYSPQNAAPMIARFWSDYHSLPAVLQRQKLSEADIAWFLRKAGWEASETYSPDKH